MEAERVQGGRGRVSSMVEPNWKLARKDPWHVFPSAFKSTEQDREDQYLDGGGRSGSEK